jgi:hypothetical protein
MPLLVGAGVFALILAGALAVCFRILERRREISESLKYALVRVTLPQLESQPYEKAKEEIGAFEQFLATLQNYRHPVVMEIAVPHIGEEIRFYFAASRTEIDALERAIHAFWPAANVERTTDYNIFNLGGESAVSVASLKEHFALPLRRYRTMDADPLVAIVNVFSKLAYEGEGAAMQCIFAQPPRNAQKALRFVFDELRRGVPRRVALQAGTLTGTLSFIGSTLSGKAPSSSGAPAGTPPTAVSERQPAPDEALIQLVSEKSAKPLIALNLRLVTSASTGERARSLLDIFEHAFDQFADPRANSVAFRRLRGGAAQQAIFDFSFRNFRPSQSILVTTEECATIVHLPTSGVGTPKLERVRAKSALAPLNLPEEGLVIGKNVFRGEERLVRILLDDKRRHLYIVGQTGTGKTALLQEMARQDIESGDGLCVVDPHGDLAETMLGLIPAERTKDVVYFNPTDIERPVGLNMLEFDQAHPEQKTFIINEMIEIMDKLYDLRQVGGPMFEQYLRNAMLLVMGDPVLKPTIMEIPKVLADAAFRKKLLSRCTNPSVVSFWTKEAERAGGEFALANMVPYITSKLNPFIANDIVRPIVGQVTTHFRLRDIMDNRKILIVNLAKGVLGETNSYLLGMIMVGKIMAAALSRADRPESERTDFTLYIDEFQNVTTKTIASILAEARKYRLSMIMAHQFIAQLKEEIRDAVFGNVGTIIAFRVGPLDAELLEKQFLPTFTKQDLVNLDNFNAYIKLLIRGQVSPPFNIQTFPPRASNREIAAAVKELSRLAYGRPRQDVEAEIARRIQE